ncbi:hypothetical protein ACTQ4E_06425 [Lawsonibacter sp. LCP25S3_G6]|uniref:hypothetical protein n=1 Tax=unclassified Lawsonibacter TaxID=2617946 RepID=UPI003F973766
MTQAKEKKVRRPFRAALIAAAAVAMMVVGVGAANPEAVQELFVQIATVVRVDEYRQEMVTSEGESITVLSIPEVNVENRDGQAILIVDEEERDITQALAEQGTYVYEKTTPQDTKLCVEVTGSAEQWEITVSMEEEGKQVGSFTTSSEENALAPGQVQDNYSVNEGVEISKAGEELNKEICVSEYDGETAAVIPVK